MGAETAIAWTDRTFNPWWGCQRVSPGCEHCYAEAFAKRTGNLVWGKNADRRFFGAKHWAEPITWDRKAGERGVRERVFCASMADVFEDREDLIEPRADVCGLVEITPNLDWQILTKRPENVARLVDFAWMEPGYWPSNAWIGTTVEDQKRADERIPELLALPAPVRFLSCEPLLEAVHLDAATLDGLSWCIIGGESGGKRRPMDVRWAEDLAAQCAGAGVAVFVKQAGGIHPGGQGELPDWLWAMKQFPT